MDETFEVVGLLGRRSDGKDKATASALIEIEQLAA
jgi:hypothetical protein